MRDARCDAASLDLLAGRDRANPAPQSGVAIGVGLAGLLVPPLLAVMPWVWVLAIDIARISGGRPTSGTTHGPA